MNRGKLISLYCIVAVVATAVIWFVLDRGAVLPFDATAQPHSSDAIPAGASGNPLAVFILQLMLIIAASQLSGYLFRKIGQPSVMGEIVAGILLGPSLVGTLFPAFSAFIFPPSSLGDLYMLSQVGLILFMFVIGMELDMDVVRRRSSAALLISNMSIAVPFTLGIFLSYFLYNEFAPAGVRFYAFALFTGIALSITAFPVLARIIRERGMARDRIGMLAITAAAVNDVAAWCILAFIVAAVNAGPVGSLFLKLGAIVIYVAVMLIIVRPLLIRLAATVNDGFLKRSSIAIIFIVLLASSYCCEVIGIHALFGAFMAGLVMPQEWSFRKLLIGKIEDVALVLLLPLFFVLTGLRTQVSLLSGPHLWLICALVILLAVLGKFGGAAFAARISGETSKDSLAIGALMNTRGLVELVVLNIGYDMHIITRSLFTIMVMMALVTTFMTNPVLNLLGKGTLKK